MPGDSRKLPRLVPGKPVPAADVNAIAAEVERLQRASVDAPLEVTRAASGRHYRLADPERLDARLTGGGTGGKYSWQGIYSDPDSPGSWLDHESTVSGTTTRDPAFEGNGNATLATGTRVRMARDRVSGAWIFWLYRCS